MKCYYEVLDISREATDSEIKTAYRKLALKWHPDKNLENSELAKEQFQIVQQAYEVLSDRHERAWYDNHREQILRGANSEFEDKSLDVFQYFNTSCFTGYKDDENGFYSIYRNVFENIAKEDMEFMENKEEYLSVPSFGNSKTEYAKVSEFYNYWLNYSTKKSYVWLDPHDISELKDRRYVKLVEKENKKVRQKAKKERNEEVRNLAAFVRKRDKRVQLQKKVQEQIFLENKKKRESLSIQKRIERQQELNELSGQPEWCKFDNVRAELEAIEKNLAEQFGEFTDTEDEEQEKYFNNLYCIACNKIFKTSKAFENHELSKKHKENVAILKETMLDENEFTDVQDNCVEENGNTILDDSVSQSDSDAVEELKQNKMKKKKKQRKVLSADVQETYAIDKNVSEQYKANDNLDFTANKKQQKKSRKNKKVKLDNVKVSEAKSIISSEKDEDTEISDQHSLDIDHNCITCKSSFPSKNKLFDHLKKTGHGVFIPLNVRSKQKNLKEK